MKVRSYKFRIYPTETQKVLLSKTFGSVRFIYNKMLAMKTEAYKVEKKSLSIFSLDKQISLLKQADETQWLKEVNSQSLQSSLRNLDMAYTKFFREKKGSKNREKSRKRLARQHERVADSRKDFIHKLTSNLVENQDYQSFAIEDLAVSNMVKNRKLSRAISDCSWGMFRQFLTYKAQRAGKSVLVIGRFEPSSKLCTCGKINQDLKLKDRNWTCSCGAIHDRDVLAANNIRDFAFQKQNTKNDSVRPERPKLLRKKKTPVEIPVTGSMKQEATSL